jgi:hypothetical protein
MTVSVSNVSQASVTVNNSTTPPAVTVTLGVQGPPGPQGQQGPPGPQGEIGTFDGAEIDGGSAASVYTAEQAVTGGTAEG